MSKKKISIEELEAKFVGLRTCIKEYDEVNCQVLVVLESCAKRVNSLIKKFSKNLKTLEGRADEAFLRKRISSSFLQHQIDELSKMYDSVNLLKCQLELVEEKFTSVRKWLHGSLSVEGFSGSEKYLNCFKQGINKAKFYISKLEILIASSHKLGNHFPENALWFKSMELYIIGMMLPKDYCYLSPYVPRELYPTE